MVSLLAMKGERTLEFMTKWEQGLSYGEFLDRYATPEQRRRWDDLHAQVALTTTQLSLLHGFQRDMLVMVVAGAWCGDCVQQCPILEQFAQQTSRLRIRYFDRDDHGDLADGLSICGGRRVPSVLFLAEDGSPCGRYGDRTLAKYRDMASKLEGAACPTGLVAPSQLLLADVTQEWLDQFERVQLMLRLSPRLRQKHGD